MEIFKLKGSVLVDTSAAEESLQRTDSKAGGLGQTLLNGVKSAGKFAAGVAAAATSAAVGLGVKAVNAANEFETSFAKVTTLLSDTEDLDAYKQSIIDLSNTMGKSTGEISEAVYGAISAGVAAEDAVAFVGQSMKLAEGGFTDAATAVDVVTTAINAYGLSAEDAGKIADKLITTQNLGKTTVDELASSMGKIIPTANSLNVDIDELCAGYAVLTSNGIATAESTTYMNSMLNELGKSGTKANNALAAYTEEAFGASMSLSELMDEGFGLNEVAVMIQEQAEKTGLSIADMFGSAEAGKAANVLAANADKFDEVFGQMIDSAGATEEAYSKMHGTMEAQMETLKTNFNNMMIQLGQKLLPAVNEVFDWLMEHMPEIEAAIDAVFAFVSSAIDEIIPVIEALMPVVEALFDGIGYAWDNYLKPIFNGIIDFLNGAFTGNWEKAFQGLADIVKGIFGVIVDLVKAPLNGIITLVNGVIDGINELEVPDWVPFLGGASPNIPHIPMLAKGGDITAGGAAIVGEAGAELIDLPTGARVTPLSGSAATLGAEDLADVIEGAIESVLSRVAIPIVAEPNTKKFFNDMRAENTIWKAQHGGSAF